ncbi:DUF551 domain-containing protein [Azospirillum sp. sgz302134]
MAEWQKIDTAPRDKTSVIVAVPSRDGGHIVGEAYFDPKAYDGSWWWAGTSLDAYHHDPIEECNFGPPTHWQPMPDPPAREAVVI